MNEPTRTQRKVLEFIQTLHKHPCTRMLHKSLVKNTAGIALPAGFPWQGEQVAVFLERSLVGK